MKENNAFLRIFKVVYNYILFFLIVSFVVTCCMTLFLSTMADTMGITFTDANIGAAAKITMLNVLLLTLLLSIGDYIRRKITVDRPVKQILDAGRKLTQGDFTVRIPTIKTIDTEDPFHEIAECFNMMAQELSSTETLRTDFIANVSHELKTPLSIMQNYGTLLQQPDLSEKDRLEYAKAITEASQRLAQLITNILKLNKLENQQIVPQVAEYDLSEQLCECMLNHEDAWEKKDLCIETDIQDGVIVEADAEMMSIVWNNLLSNAIKFTEKGGTVSLGVKTIEDNAVVTIADTGCGISPEIGKHIFDKFYQGDTSHATEGNGLGLALVKRVVDLMGCDISVESEFGKGTIFTVTMRRKLYD